MAISAMSQRTWWTGPPPLVTPQCATFLTPPRPSLRKFLKIWWVILPLHAQVLDFHTPTLHTVDLAQTNSLSPHSFFSSPSPLGPPLLMLTLLLPPGSSGDSGLPHAPSWPRWFRLGVSPPWLCKYLVYSILWLLVTANVNRTTLTIIERISLSGFSRRHIYIVSWL